MSDKSRDKSRRVHELILKQRSITAKIQSGQIYDAKLIETSEPKEKFIGQGE